MMRASRTTLLFSLFAVLAAPAAHAQLYKWVGPDGKVTYSDSPPPPAAAKQVERKAIGQGGALPTAGLPFALAEAVRQHPVTLYTTANCGICDDGRRLLQSRGVPFAEKTVTTSEDIAKLRAAGNSGQLPYLTVGSQRQQGFETGAWNAALDAAGYPASNMLPKSYRSPQAEPAAPVVASAAPAAPTKPASNAADPAPATALPAAAGNAPPGFRF